ncbi:MAG: lipoyl(octanoyl) transferase LipB [Bacteroidota bacterium]
MKNIILTDWGTIDYREAWRRQEEIFDRQIDNKQNKLPTENNLIFCEHPHVYTIGKSGNAGNMLIDDGTVPVYRTDRGGDITYHGFGQIVGYPVFDLESLGIGLREYITRLEEAVIRLLDNYDIEGGHFAEGTGVWIDTALPSKTRKICAIGVRSSRYVTMHGFALNVNTDLSYFGRINPCGFTDRGVTSMKKELGKSLDIEEVKQKLFKHIEEVFYK